MLRYLKRLRPAICSHQKSTSKTELQSLQDIDILARTIWGEARGEGVRGMISVANVIMNRLALSKKHNGYWWGDTLSQICQKPYQFSCWNADDPNRDKLLKVGTDDVYFVTALRIARRALANVLEDHTNGATHYHNKSVSPAWARTASSSITIGNHIFYKKVL